MMLPVFFLYVTVIVGYAFLTDEMKGWIRDWRKDTWDRIRHRA